MSSLCLYSRFPVPTGLPDTISNSLAIARHTFDRALKTEKSDEVLACCLRGGVAVGSQADTGRIIRGFSMC